MKIIFSRKGFDSSYGGYPSIILPKEMGSKMISFPIPEAGTREKDKATGKYKNITSAGIKGKGAEDIKFMLEDGSICSLEKILNEILIDKLNKSKDKKIIKKPDKKTKIEETIFHYDPAIQETYDENRKNIKGHHGYAAFGQSGAAAGHLLNQKICRDDVFLFFGTFRPTEIKKDGDKEIISYTKDKEFHALWGYMIVDDIFLIDAKNSSTLKKVEDYNKKGEPITSEYNIDNKDYPNLRLHPHFSNKEEYKVINKEQETKYITNLIICSKNGRFGTFSYTGKQKLTREAKEEAKDMSKRHWKLDQCFKDTKFSYCGSVKEEGNEFYLASASIGQEFVVNVDEKKEKEIVDWLKAILPEEARERLGAKS